MLDKNMLLDFINGVTPVCDSEFDQGYAEALKDVVKAIERLDTARADSVDSEQKKTPLLA
jgi:hypothetical protein